MSPDAVSSDSEKSKKSKPESDDAGSEEILLPELCADIDAGDNSESAAPGPGGPPLVRKGKRKASAKAKRSSCPKPKAKAVAKAKQKGKAEYPPGSQETIDDFNLWAEELFRALKQHLAAIGEHDVHKMWEELSKITVVLTTSYSGVGSPEWAVLFLLQAFRDLGYSLNIIFYSACDCDKLCQSLLMAHHQKPMHVFSDLCSRLPADPFFELKTLQKNYIEQYSQERERAEGSGAGFGKKEKKMLAKQLGDDFFEEACALLSEVIFDKNTTCWCVACKKMCKVSIGGADGQCHLDRGRGQHLHALERGGRVARVARPRFTRLVGLGLVARPDAANACDQRVHAHMAGSSVLQGSVDLCVHDPEHQNLPLKLCGALQEATNLHHGQPQ